METRRMRRMTFASRVQLELRLEAEPRICIRKFVLNCFLLSFNGFSL